MHWSNRFYIGVLLGLIIPILLLIFYVKFMFRETPLFQVIQFLITLKGFSPLLAISVLPNLLSFYLFLNKEYWFAAKGVLFTTLIMGITVFWFAY